MTTPGSLAAAPSGADRTDRLEWVLHPTPIGDLLLVASSVGLYEVVLPGSRAGRSADAAVGVGPGDNPVLDAAATQIDEYFEGDRTTFDLPLDLRGTAFQVAAWRALATIPYGETITYAEQAARAGRPRAFRAVGAANGANPVALVLPCHRVIGSDGSLTGFGGGLEMKSRLLELERTRRR